MQSAINVLRAAFFRFLASASARHASFLAFDAGCDFVSAWPNAVGEKPAIRNAAKSTILDMEEYSLLHARGNHGPDNGETKAAREECNFIRGTRSRKGVVAVQASNG